MPFFWPLTIIQTQRIINELQLSHFHLTKQNHSLNAKTIPLLDYKSKKKEKSVYKTSKAIKAALTFFDRRAEFVRGAKVYSINSQ